MKELIKLKRLRGFYSMLNQNSILKIDSLVKELNKEQDIWQSLAIAIDLADEILKIILPQNEVWEKKLTRNTQVTGKLPDALPLDVFKNQKQVKWFNEHPNSNSARSAFKLFYEEDCPIESNFFWFSDSATKQKISASTELTVNWEDSNLTRNPHYKVGIDFFLKPDANSLLIVISNHHKLRVLELSEHLTNTQKLIFKEKLNGAASYTGIENGVRLEFEPQKTIHATLWNALQLKEVNKQFYSYISQHFKELVLCLENNGKDTEDAKQFSSRLLGRLLFVWFLRKMDIIDESYGYFETENETSTDYYENKLKVLFFSTLNREISDRMNGDINTPYLNGGLFESKENDFVHEVIEFPKSYFSRMYEHFNEFNFTTDESSADFELIAVDPEMLGQVFESLLATQLGEEETNTRNDTGSFYTPREIVGYMVKETLRQYLYSNLEESAHKGVDDLLDLSDSLWINRKSTSNIDIWGVNSSKVIKKIITLLDNFKVLDPAVGSGAFPMGMLQQLVKTYERLGVNKDSYSLKLSIIENNLFGIDLQPMAIEISRLRAWLSVIVDESNNENVHPLPNLDFKFIAANSLIKLADGQGNIFSDPDLDRKLSKLREEYFSTKNKKKKSDLQAKYYTLTTDSLDDDERTLQLKTFDPFKNHSAAEFFDPKIMFGIEDGFDAVIGNPPYIHFEKMNVNQRNFYKNNADKLGFETYTARGDIYTLFYEKGINLLKHNGILSFITSNKWMRAAYGEKLRNFFVSKTNPLLLIDLGGNVFESATVDTNILILQNEKYKDHLLAISINDRPENMSEYIRHGAIKISYRENENWIILSEIEQSIKKKIEQVGTPLKDWDIKINRGILTGLNEAFIISKEKKDELIKADPKSAEIIRPILRGRDIKKNEINFSEKYLIALFPSKKYNIDNYPAIKDWLINGEWVQIKTKGNPATPIGTGKERLEQTGKTHIVNGIKFRSRKKTSNKWFETQDSIGYWDDLNNPKILYSEIVNSPHFYLDNSGKFIPEATAFMLSGSELDVIIRYLNSLVITWIFKTYYSGGGLGKGFRYKKQYIEKLPIPRISILNNYDIEQQIVKIYQFNEEEIDYIFNLI